MSNGTFTIAALAILTSLTGFPCVPAHAGISYSYVSDKTNYVGLPGGTVTVELYLKETLTGGSTSFLASDGGVAFMTVVAKRLPNAFPDQPAPYIQNVAPNVVDFPFFTTFSNRSAAGDMAEITGAPPIGSGVFVGNSGGGAAPAISDEVYLGSLTIALPNNNVTVFTLGALDPMNGGNTVTSKSAYDLDLGVDGNFSPTNLFVPVGNTLTTFTVGFPEPGALGVFACCGGLLAVRRRRAAASHSNA
ncbi:MAG: hypothetical protein JWN24_534 [Phycisphaerales bacterium]|nr:hypothetical protein [Phycisphaerales bacterium]